MKNNQKFNKIINNLGINTANYKAVFDALSKSRKAVADVLGCTDDDDDLVSMFPQRFAFALYLSEFFQDVPETKKNKLVITSQRSIDQKTFGIGYVNGKPSLFTILNGKFHYRAAEPGDTFNGNVLAGMGEVWLTALVEFNHAANGWPNDQDPVAEVSSC